jgi:hypothetical protein
VDRIAEVDPTWEQRVEGVRTRVEAGDLIAVPRVRLRRQVRLRQDRAGPRPHQIHPRSLVRLRLEWTAVDRDLDEDVEEAVDLERSVTVVCDLCLAGRLQDRALADLDRDPADVAAE